jgi:hypothetical protein
MIKAMFDKGQIPTIVVINKAATPLGVDLDKLIAALQLQLDRDFVPRWGTPAKLVKGKDFVKGSWAIVFLDDADQPGALAYHDLTPDGLPLSKVFVRTTVNAGELVSVSTSHELLEMLVDPAINLMSDGPDPKLAYAYEVCDAVEETTYLVGGIALSNFVFPSFFETFRKPKSTQFDFLGKLTRPFQLLKGGYQSVWKNGKWTSVFASSAKGRRFSSEDRRGHRSESRGKQLKRARV